MDKANPDMIIRSQSILASRLLDVPRKDIPCKVEFAVKVLNTSLNDWSVPSNEIIYIIINIIKF